MAEFLQTAKENLSFLLVCLLVFVGLVLLARASEKLLIKRPQRLSSPRSIAYIAMFSAIAAALMFLEIPLFFAPSFYEIDLSEVPVLICTFYLGPVAGVICEFLKVLLKLLLKGTSTAYVGDFANFALGCTLVLPASIAYHCKKTKKAAIWGMVLGTMIMTVFGSLFNAFFLIPKYVQLFGMPLDVIVGMGTAVNPAITSLNTLVLFAVVPFNIVKGVIVSFMTLLLYKRVERLLK